MTRERGRRTLVPLQWGRIDSNLTSLKGKHWEIRKGRHFAIVHATRVEFGSNKYVLCEGGIFSPGKIPTQWKSGEDAVKKVRLESGHEWIHQGFFAFPTVGNQVIVQGTRNGPHIKDICEWIREYCNWNFCQNTYVPVGDFADLVKKKKRYHRALVKVQIKPSLAGKSPTYLLSQLGSDVGAARVTIIVEPSANRFLDPKKVKDFIGKYVGGISGSTYSPKDDDSYQLSECELLPEDESGNIEECLRFIKGSRRLSEVEAGKDGIIQRIAIKDVFTNEFIDWLGTT